MDPVSFDQLGFQLHGSSVKVQENLTSMLGRLIIWGQSATGTIPAWAEKHIDLHKLLEKSIKERLVKGEAVSKNAIATLQESSEIILKLAEKIDSPLFMDALSSTDTGYVGFANLLKPLNPDAEPIPSNLEEWELNFGLLYSAYQRTDNEEIKKTIRFLMINYFVKAAFLNINVGVMLSEEETEKYQNMMQLGEMTLQGLYQRGSHQHAPYLDLFHLTETLGSGSNQGLDFIPMDTMEIEDLYAISFTSTPDIGKKDEIVAILVSQFEANIDKFPSANMDYPLLIDVTKQMGQSVITDGNPEKIKAYEDKLQEVREQVNEMVTKAAATVRQKYPDRDDIQKKAADYMKTNIALVSRVKINDYLAVLNTCPNLFTESDFEEKVGSLDPLLSHQRQCFINDKILLWSDFTGISVGGVNTRRLISEMNPDPLERSLFGKGQPVEYAVPGRTDIVLYEKPSGLIESNTFRMMSDIGEGKKNAGKAQEVLAKATVSMMETLAAKISNESWTNKQEDPAIRELTQVAVHRAWLHLANAVQHVHDFRQFSQAIDCVHADLTLLLTLYTPFDPASLEKRYSEFLKPNFPPSMHPSMIGIGKSAMSVYAGVNAAIIKDNPDAVRICAPHSYYEQATLLGNALRLDQALEDPDVDKIDLYTAEFYHNIDIDPAQTNYQKGTVIQDIKEIFRKKTKTNQLTVVIDATIDYAQSKDIKELLSTFEKEINEGKLNIVVIRSGQKFDMMGLDNYFGGFYYAVNNGDKKWDKFKNIKNDAVYQTDELSQQYFCWLSETGPEIMDEYKRQIFANTREILNSVPSTLKPQSGSEVCVSTFEPDVLTPFFEININFSDEDKKMELRLWAQERFAQLFIAEDKLIYRRGSFGFAHPNVTWIDPKLRITPGLDSDENRIYSQFFAELAEKIEEMK